MQENVGKAGNAVENGDDPLANDVNCICNVASLETLEWHMTIVKSCGKLRYAHESTRLSVTSNTSLCERWRVDC